MFENFHTLRSSFRGLRRRPDRAVFAVVVLALGLAASTTLLTFLNSLLQHVPGVADAHRLVRVYGFEGSPWGRLSYPDYEDLAKRQTVIEGLAAEMTFGGSLRLANGTHWTLGRTVSGNYFSLLGVEMTQGRALTVDDDRPEAAPAVVLSDAFRRQHLPANDSVLGTVVQLDGQPFTVVGVAPPAFTGLTSGLRTDLWIPAQQAPASAAPWLEDRAQPRVVAVGRLSSGATTEQFRAEAQAAAHALDQAYPPGNTTRQFRVQPAKRFDAQDQLSRLPVGVGMLVASALLLLLACANVANLQFAVATERRRELALRSALGAGRNGVLRLLVTENLMLALAAGTLGLLLAGPGSARMTSYFSQQLPYGVLQAETYSVDLRVFALAMAVALTAGLLIGLLTAWKAIRRDLVSALKGSDVVPSGGLLQRLGGRSLLVSAQVALSAILLVLAGLTLSSLGRASDVEAGFDVDSLLVANFNVAAKELPPEQGQQYFRQLRDHLQATPGVRSVALAAHVPLSGTGSRKKLEIEGGQALPIAKMTVGERYVETLGLEVQRGRALTADDTQAIMVNERLVNRYFAGQEPLGRRLWSPATNNQPRQSFEVVGVVADTRIFRIRDEPEPLVYFPWHQASYKPRNTLVFSTSMDPATVIPAIRGKLRDLDPHLALVGVEPLSEVVRGTLFDQHMIAELCAALALLGLAMAAAGIFSLMSLTVGRRRREIGVRMALGAHRSDVVGLVVRQALSLVGVGLVLGLVLSWTASRFLQSLLYGVKATDPATFTVAAIVLLAVTTLASLPAAFLAASVDPVRSLRSE